MNDELQPRNSDILRTAKPTCFDSGMDTAYDVAVAAERVVREHPHANDAERYDILIAACGYSEQALNSGEQALEDARFYADKTPEQRRVGREFFGALTPREPSTSAQVPVTRFLVSRLRSARAPRA